MNRYERLKILAETDITEGRGMGSYNPAHILELMESIEEMKEFIIDFPKLDSVDRCRARTVVLDSHQGRWLEHKND